MIDHPVGEDLQSASVRVGVEKCSAVANGVGLVPLMCRYRARTLTHALQLRNHGFSLGQQIAADLALASQHTLVDTAINALWLLSVL